MVIGQIHHTIQALIRFSLVAEDSGQQLKQISFYLALPLSLVHNMSRADVVAMCYCLFWRGFCLWIICLLPFVPGARKLYWEGGMKVTQPADLREQIRAAIADELGAVADYATMANLVVNPTLKALILSIAGDEYGHARTFMTLLELLR